MTTPGPRPANPKGRKPLSTLGNQKPRTVSLDDATWSALGTLADAIGASGASEVIRLLVAREIDHRFHQPPHRRSPP